MLDFRTSETTCGGEDPDRFQGLRASGQEASLDRPEPGDDQPLTPPMVRPAVMRRRNA